MSVQEIAKLSGRDSETIRENIARGWSAEQLLGLRPSPREEKANVTGKRFGRLFVLEEDIGSGRRLRKFLCRCDCGKKVCVLGSNLRRGVTKSCGCYRKEVHARVHKTHGMKNSPEFSAWMAMKYRCLNPSCAAFKNYGGRGISVFDGWVNDFVSFFREVGPRPSKKHSLDRIDNSKGYFPGNVRWATRIEQERNKRSNRILEFDGNTMTISEAAGKYGILPGTIADRLSCGWSVEDSLTIPVRKRAVNGRKRNTNQKCRSD